MRLVAGLLLLGLLAPVVRCSVAAEPATRATLGKITQFALHDLAGGERSLAAWAEQRGVVIVVLGIECPISNGYSEELNRLAETCRSQQVLMLGIHGDPDVDRDQARQHAAAYRLKFPICLDAKQVVVRQLGVRTMPESVVLLPTGEIVYRGRIDDRYASLGRQRVAPQQRDLQRAIEAVVAGRLPEIAEAPAIGCTLPRLPPELREAR